MCDLVEGLVKEVLWPSDATFNSCAAYARGPAECRLWTYDSPYGFSSLNLTLPSSDVQGSYFSISIFSTLFKFPSYTSWRYKFFGQSDLRTQKLAFNNIDLTRSYNVGSQFERRWIAFTILVYLLWFLTSGFVLQVRVRKGGDFVTAIMERTRHGRLRLWDVVYCCILELYLLFWLEFMIGFMLQDF
jgi:hypothetical protein